MILADKIIRLRRKNGWSQEELAEKMNVSRQAVSKWESAQTVPDLEKILMLGALFGVTTDYLLKDELESEEFTSGEDSAIRRLTLAEANEYLALRKTASVRMAAATFLCIVSVIPLLILSALAESPAYGILENTASAAGLIVLFLFIAAAVAAFLSCSFKNAPYAFLDKEPFDTEYGVTGMVSERQRQYKSTYARCNMVGTMLCILSPVPIFIGMAEGSDLAMILAVCGMLFLAGVGAAVFVVTGVRWAGMQKILQSGDYAPAEKSATKRRRHFPLPTGRSLWLCISAGTSRPRTGRTHGSSGRSRVCCTRRCCIFTVCSRKAAKTEPPCFLRRRAPGDGLTRE